MRNVTLRQMRVFAAVARYGSFTRAARELRLTQPAVSQQIKLLEQEAGLPLFEHIGRTIHVTAAGQELLRYATQVTDLLREAGETLAAMRGLKRGLLKLGAVSTAKYFAPSLLSAFAPAYPALCASSRNWMTSTNAANIANESRNPAALIALNSRPANSRGGTIACGVRRWWTTKVASTATPIA